MTEDKLCGGKTFKEVMQEVDFHISDKQRIAKLEKEKAELKSQIEKMKNCQNCKYDYYRVCISKIRCENLEQWECKE